jgi:hypothetical protein
VAATMSGRWSRRARQARVHVDAMPVMSTAARTMARSWRWAAIAGGVGRRECGGTEGEN